MTTADYRYPRFLAPRHVPLSHANDNNPPGGTPPRGATPVGKLTDAQLQALEHNFVEKSALASKHYILKDIRRELLRRATAGIDGGEVVRVILSLAGKSPDCFTTYGELHAKLWADKRFVGHGSMTKVKKALGAAILYCVQNGLPCVTTLVVQAGERTLSERASVNICDTLRGLGVEVGSNIEEYVLEQTLAAMDVVANFAKPTAA
jgi:hypothetical protein